MQAGLSLGRDRPTNGASALCVHPCFLRAFALTLSVAFLPRSLKGGDGGEDRAHQAIIAAGGFDAPLLGAVAQDAVDIGLGAAEKPVGQAAESSAASRARNRAMAASCSASLSAAVVTVT